MGPEPWDDDMAFDDRDDDGPEVDEEGFELGDDEPDDSGYPISRTNPFGERD
jgi:hypothetical protein